MTISIYVGFTIWPHTTYGFLRKLAKILDSKSKKKKRMGKQANLVINLAVCLDAVEYILKTDGD